MIWSVYSVFSAWYHGKSHRFVFVDTVEAMTRENAIKIAYDVLIIEAKNYFNTKNITYGELITEYCYPIEKVDY